MLLTGESVVHGSKARPQDLPSIDKLLRLPEVQQLVQRHGHTLITTEARGLLDALRSRILRSEVNSTEILPETLVKLLVSAIDARLKPRMQRVINLTGTVIH